MLVRFSNLDVDFPVQFSSNLTEHLNKLITVFRITRKLQELRLDINYRKVYRKGPEFRAADLKVFFFFSHHIHLVIRNVWFIMQSQSGTVCTIIYCATQH